jgi:hypothetical protein
MPFGLMIAPATLQALMNISEAGVAMDAAKVQTIDEHARDAHDA